MAVRRFSFTLLLCLFLLSLQAGLPGQTNRKKTHSKKSSSSAQSTQKLHHIKRAFVASADLQPMAQQLLEQRSPQAYAGVEEYAHRHRKDDAGPLAWLVIGYAHLLDKDYVKARESWTHSAPIEPVLGDYLDYFRAMAYQGESNPAEIIKTLEGFEQKYPDSVFSHDVAMLYAGALMATGETQKAIAWLEKHRHGAQSDLEFALGKAYLSVGEKDKASAIFRHVYFDYPIAAEAELAAQELRGLGEMQPSGSFDQRRARADVMLKSRHYPEAVNEFSSLVEQAPSEKIADLQVQFVTALYRARKRDDAQRLFETVSQNANASVEDRAQTLYFLAEIARDKDDHDRHGEFISELRTLAPESAWFQEALLSSGNMYMLKNDFDKAAPFYSEIYQRQQNGRFSPYAHWKAAWLTYRMGKKDEAKRLFEEQLTMYPSSNEAPAALYWRGRIAEDEGDKPLARAYYQKLSENYRYYYYANLGRARLTQIGLQDVADPPMLDKLPSPTSLPHNWDAPTDNVRAQKAQVLENAAMFDFAVKELQASAPASSPWLARAIAQVYQDQGSYIHAIETMKRAVPGYFSAEVSQLPRPVWEALFPRPYWDDLKRNSQLNQLDPYLMASLIRQESEFNPAAISPKNAMGLMQLLPPVGKGLAKEVKHHHFTSDELLVPATNLQLGTRYFRHMVEHYDGRVEYALAAYNAGEDRVDDWRKAGTFKDMDEFVESIPFTETREYVQAIMRNAVLYKLLYPKG